METVGLTSREFRIIHRVLDREGYLADIPRDSGGKTVFGIASNFWPAWFAWVMEPSSYFERQERALQFYASNFYRPLRCQDIRSDPIAEELLDTAVNTGRVIGIRLTQHAVNLMHSALGRAKIGTDGKIAASGRSETIDALNGLLPRYERNVLGWQNYFQGHYYFTLWTMNPGKYGHVIHGWGLRLLA